MTKQVGTPDRAELRIDSYEQLTEQHLGVDFGVQVFDNASKPIEGWRFRIRSAASELVNGVTDASGSFRGRRIVLVQQGVEERFILLLDDSSVGDWKSIHKERQWSADEKRKELEEIRKGNGGIVKAGEKLTLSPPEYTMKGWIEVEEGAVLTIEAGTILKFARGNGIRCKGRLLAIGTPQKPIYFTAAEFQDAKKQDPIHWGNITLMGKGVSGSKISYCGIAYGESPDYGGGLALLEAEDVEISNVSLHGNRAQCGGGIGSNESSNIRMEKITVSENKASQGGGIWIRGGAVDVFDFKVEKNHAQMGGGIYMASGYELQGSYLMPIAGGSIELDRGVIEDNTAETSGGGICIMSGIKTDQGARKKFGIKKCRIKKNRGEGIFILNASLIWGGTDVYTGFPQEIQISDSQMTENVNRYEPNQISVNNTGYHSNATLTKSEVTLPIFVFSPYVEVQGYKGRESLYPNIAVIACEY